MPIIPNNFCNKGGKTWMLGWKNINNEDLDVFEELVMWLISEALVRRVL